jgi:hypothetical protein
LVFHLPARKVGEIDTGRFSGDRFCRQVVDDAPRGGIVNVDVGGDAVSEAFDKPVQFDVIGAAVAVALGLLTDFLPEGVFKFLGVAVECFPGMFWASAMDVNLALQSLMGLVGKAVQCEIVKDAFLGRDVVDAAVGTGQLGIVVKRDGAIL